MGFRAGTWRSRHHQDFPYHNSRHWWCHHQDFDLIISRYLQHPPHASSEFWLLFTAPLTHHKDYWRYQYLEHPLTHHQILMISIQSTRHASSDYSKHSSRIIRFWYSVIITSLLRIIRILMTSIQSLPHAPRIVVIGIQTTPGPHAIVKILIPKVSLRSTTQAIIKILIRPVRYRYPPPLVTILFARIQGSLHATIIGHRKKNRNPPPSRHCPWNDVRIQSLNF